MLEVQAHICQVVAFKTPYHGHRFRVACEVCPFSGTTLTEDDAYSEADFHYDGCASRDELEGRLARVDEVLAS